MAVADSFAKPDMPPANVAGGPPDPNDIVRRAKIYLSILNDTARQREGAKIIAALVELAEGRR